MTPLRILFVSSEVAPFAKTGGLADVSAALPRQLHRLGHDVRLYVPLYRSVREQPLELVAVAALQNLPIRIGERIFSYSIRTATLPGTALEVHFVDCPALYDRPGIYTQDADEQRRFLLLTRAALECCQRTQWSPHVAHWNDWQTALGPLYLKSRYAWDRLFKPTRSVLTIHNLGYQGTFSADTIGDLSLGDAVKLLHQDDLRDGRVSFLKLGLLYADMLTTVSPTYAREIQTEPHGMGLHDVLRRRRAGLVGILNGVDDEWNPRSDPLIPVHYSAKSLWRKEKNKEQLLRALGLRYEKAVPVVGIVTRLSAQKGIELLRPTIPDLLRAKDLRFVALGSGEPRHEKFLAQVQEAFVGKACFYQGFNNRLAHLIEAGADVFLMPSLYEPCGLNQMYSMRYGTVPVVRKTGGLADTVVHFDPKTGKGTGFVFEQPTARALRGALDLALEVYADRRAWAQLQRNGMERDFSWETQAELYVKLYRGIAPRAEVMA